MITSTPTPTMSATPLLVADDPILDISLELSGRDPIVSSKIEVSFGGHVTSVEFRRDELSQFGIPVAAKIPSKPSLPADYSEALTSALPPLPLRVLWLRLNQPAGYLSAVPWEGVQIKERVLLRLPDKMALPQNVSRYERLAIVACTAGGDGEELADHLRSFVAQLRRRIPQLEVHLFANDATCDAMDHIWSREARLTTHRPHNVSAADSPKLGREPDTSPFAISRIVEGLNGAAVQALHIVMPGAFDVCDPVLVVRNLERRQPIAFADADDVKKLADSVGAPLVSLTSTSSGNEVAVRMIADTVGATRPGPSVYASIQPMSRIPRDLAEAHDRIGNRRGSLSENGSNSPLLFYYVQPEVLENEPPTARGTGSRGMPEYGLRGGVSPWIGRLGIRAFEPDGAPRGSQLPLWFASSSRFIESRRVDLERQTTDEPKAGRPGTAYLQGAAAALDAIEALVASESAVRP